MNNELSKIPRYICKVCGSEVAIPGTTKGVKCANCSADMENGTPRIMEVETRKKSVYCNLGEHDNCVLPYCRCECHGKFFE
jgi:hypothetical protein